MEKNNNLKNNTNNQNWWQEGLNTFYLISGWIAVPVIAALFIGKWLDAKYQTGPRYLLICVGVAFVISNTGLIIEIIKYSKKLKSIDKKNVGNQHKS